MIREFDRTTQDVGNIIALEHVNTTVPDQTEAHLFYVSGMGFTRDPYIDFGLRNMWVNLGRQQFHLPIGKAQVLRGRTGVVVPCIDSLKSRLARVAELFKDSRMAWSEQDEFVEVTNPWGNKFEVHGPSSPRGMQLGMPYVQFDVAPGTTPGIARFYRELLDAPATIVNENDTTMAIVSVGSEQSLRFREVETELPPYDGHHIAIYIADFSKPHQLLADRDLVSQESNESQYRFQHIVEPDTNTVLFEIEHEVRSLKHPMYARPLVNRNPTQTNVDYLRGQDAFQT